MKEKISNEQLRVRSNGESCQTDDLHRLIAFFVSVIPFLHYVPSSFLLIVAGAAVMIIPRARRLVTVHKEMFWVSMAIVMISGVGACISKNPVGLAVTLGIFLILVLGCYLRSVMTPSLTEYMADIVGCGSVFTFGIVIVQRLVERNPGYRPTGWQWNANYLGAVAVLSTVIMLYRLFDGYGCDGSRALTPKRLFFAGAILANCATIMICESRSSLLALMASVAVLLLMKRQYILFGLGAVCGIGIWALGYFFPEAFGWANSLTYVFMQRFDIWMCALRSALQGPLEFIIGRGPMTYRHVWAEEGLYGADHAHNIFFDTLINVGVIGVILYAALLVNILKNALKMKKSGDRTAFEMTVTALVTILVQGIADVTIMWHQTACLFILMCAYRSEKK